MQRSFETLEQKYGAHIPDEPPSAPRAGTPLNAAPASPDDSPQPLPDLPKVQPFNEKKLLPEALRPWVMDIADRMQCPPDYPAVATLVTLASVVGRQLAIRPKQKDDWAVVPNLWGAVVGRPGVLKTPAIQEPLRMLERLEQGAKEEYDRAMAEYEAEQLYEKIAAKESEKAIAKAYRDNDHGRARKLAQEALASDMERPIRRRYLTNDPTVEKLGELLSDNPNGLLLFRDELVGWLASLDREGREGTRQFFLESWNGTGGYTYDRVGRGTVEIEATTVSVLGGIQPGPLGDYIRAASKGGAADDGLVQRLQLIVYPDLAEQWVNVDRLPDTPARDKAWETYQRLASLNPHQVGATIPESGTPFVRFTPEAQEFFDVWRGNLEKKLRSDSLSSENEGHLSKYRSLIPSLALIFHATSGTSAGVTLDSLLMATAWDSYLRKHVERIYGSAGSSEISRGQALLKHIRRGAIDSPFTPRDVYRRGWKLLDREGTKIGLSVLEEYGWVTSERKETAGRTRTEYQINPEARHE